ncbi:RNA polymerase sigma factor [Coralloluteibacterium stylophorae]|uniref:Sigma-70 family RNA polymerase sigma factor n=1 Tax=Coralloluteibacterium stylophorae TaxID=1776034 RepID=A0A8J7VV21_9GAMM|nr:sigma-70 family RNA polymerase sigma factor [Coralloluteibacterium stylophorae]MBS7458651.1 sigma-70 family RNA polymerase sigma factor [Coralloluteibacterium stylophorae]
MRAPALAPDDLRRLRHAARRHAATREDADDLVQEVLLAAVQADRFDLPWLHGVLRRQAAFAVRGATRRRVREQAWQDAAASIEAEPEPRFAKPFLASLPRALRQLAVLVLAGLDRREIAHLLALNDAALRQRIHALHRAVARAGAAARADPDAMPPAQIPASGPLRRVLRTLLARLPDAHMATHDPDGHPLLIGAHVPSRRGNTQAPATPAGHPKEIHP